TVRLLVDHAGELPQPDGDLALADAYQAANDLPHATEYYQRVYYYYPSGDAAIRAAAALLTLRDTMGAAYPPPSAAMRLRRGDRLLEMRDYAGARAEFQTMAPDLVGIDRDRALARVGSTELWRGQVRPALEYLRGLQFAESDADAERLYYITECA